MARLEIEPEFRGGVKSLREQPRCFRRDSALPPHEFIDALNWNLEMGGKRDLRLSERYKKFLAKYDARMARNSILRLHHYPR